MVLCISDTEGFIFYWFYHQISNINVKHKPYISEVSLKILLALLSVMDNRIKPAIFKKTLLHASECYEVKVKYFQATEHRSRKLCKKAQE